MKRFQYTITKIAHHEEKGACNERRQVYTDAGTLEVEHFEAALSHIQLRVKDFPGNVVAFDILELK